MKKIFSVFLSVIILLSALSISVFSLTSGSYTYELEDGKAVITGYSANASELTLPSSLGGYPVYAVGEGAFRNKTSLTSVTIPEGVCEIRGDAFNSCTSLATINLPSTLISFGENAIYNTAYYNNTSNWTIRPENLTSSGGVNVGSSDPNASGGNTIPYEFLAATELEYIYCGTVLVKCHVVGSYTIKGTTTAVADGAFYGESGIKSVTLSSNLRYIGENAFRDCTSLAKITLSNDKCKIGENAFYNTSFYNNEANWADDVLVIGSRAVTTRCNSKEMVINGKITVIGNNVIGAKDVYIPSSVTYIDLEAFIGTTSIIYGYADTYAESFAHDNGFIFVYLDEIILGDLDFDGSVTHNDYAIYYETVTCRHELSRYEQMAGDVTLDGAIDAMDAIYIQLLINDKTATVKGDINGDGKVNQADYVLLRQYVNCNVGFVGTNVYMRSDVNGDGTVDMMDVIYLDLYLHGKVSL